MDKHAIPRINILISTASCLSLTPRFRIYIQSHVDVLITTQIYVYLLESLLHPNSITSAKDGRNLLILFGKSIKQLLRHMLVARLSPLGSSTTHCISHQPPLGVPNSHTVKIPGFLVPLGALLQIWGFFVPLGILFQISTLPLSLEILLHVSLQIPYSVYSSKYRFIAVLAFGLIKPPCARYEYHSSARYYSLVYLVFNLAPPMITAHSAHHWCSIITT